MADDRVAILVPMDVEVRPVVRALGVRRMSDGGPTAWAGRVGRVDVTVHMIGIGPNRARRSTEHVLATHTPDRVVVCGIAGGLGPTTLGELVVPAEVIDGTSGERFEAHRWGTAEPSGSLVTTDGMWSAEQLADHADDGVLAVDMETAAVAAVALAASTAWTAIRGISDLVAAGTVDASTLALTRPDGRTDVGAAIGHIARRPWRVPHLRRIASDTRRATTVATDAVASALRAGG